MTRMWMVEPSIMCRNHLLGEHKEIHQLIGTLRMKCKVDGYVKNNLIEVSSMIERHQQLVVEMLNRGYNHNSELKEFKIDYLSDEIKNYKIDKEKSLKDLLCRCENCQKRVMNKSKPKK